MLIHVPADDGSRQSADGGAAWSRPQGEMTATSPEFRMKRGRVVEKRTSVITVKIEKLHCSLFG